MTQKKVRETTTASYTKTERPLLKTGLTVGVLALVGYLGYKLLWPKLMAVGSGGGGVAQPYPTGEWKPVEQLRQPVLEQTRQPILERPIEQLRETTIVKESYPEGYP